LQTAAQARKPSLTPKIGDLFRIPGEGRRCKGYRKKKSVRLIRIFYWLLNLLKIKHLDARHKSFLGAKIGL
jgi:hypothetical protein